MDWLEATVLGIIQGLTEFLPVSSTGHLYLGRHLFGLDEAGLFLDTMLHLGTLLAVLAVYREEVTAVLKDPFGPMGRLLVAGTIPTVIIGLAFKDFFEEISETGVTIGWEFLVTGWILWLSDNWKRHGHKGLEEISYTDAVFIGTFQGAAILPAISRSGLTIAAALFRRIDKSTAAHFSFFLSIPAIAGALLLQFVDLMSGQTQVLPLSSLLMATLMSALFGYLAVRWMINLLKRGSLKIFAAYVWGLGLVVLFFQWTGRF
ncbi:undecaprenyl-diphosphate phosphatase [Kroppenstedtia eburnea]|uniref:Undecaprenyl-diphosphatase n=1 Tax=Kroppenstedtia eburnea TaxID=714067 RepID=A0A1N7NRP3_9BACL|nr:undecaprenyl-diphosphate phosphatase [Kroppenstedtia eburnea]QKI81133.1 undecaprenyl-diphosphate phosphatase [Kroppenstedtia eburnea]SIT01055.1 undecaprenyl-diphosphatase [Kroppenstedtia eburnea]